MATREIVELVDDINGDPAEGTTRFMLDDVNYEIDLSAPNAVALRETLGRYIDHARKLSKTPPPRAGRQRSQTDASVADAAKSHRRKARQWAKMTGWVNPATGKPVGDIGVVPAQLLADYDAAQRVASTSDEGNGRHRAPATLFAEPVIK